MWGQPSAVRRRGSPARFGIREVSRGLGIESDLNVANEGAGKP